MPFQRVPDTAQINVVGQKDNQTIINTFYGQKPGGYNLADLEALAGQVDEWVGLWWLPQMASDYEYLRTEVRGLDTEFDQVATNSDNTGTGELAGATMPNNVSLAVKRRSAFTGRGARGRIYTPPPPAEAFASDNVITTTWADAVEAALNTLSGFMDNASFAEVIVHRIAAGVPLPVAVVFTVVEYVVVNTTIDSMRRRLPGRGV